MWSWSLIQQATRFSAPGKGAGDPGPVPGDPHLRWIFHEPPATQHRDLPLDQATSRDKTQVRIIPTSVSSRALARRCCQGENSQSVSIPCHLDPCCCHTPDALCLCSILAPPCHLSRLTGRVSSPTFLIPGRIWRQPTSASTSQLPSIVFFFLPNLEEKVFLLLS